MATKQYERPVEGRSISREVGGKVAPAGLWRHPESGQEAIVQEGDPLFGNAQAQAFLQTGFKFVREARPDEIHSLPELAADSRQQEEQVTRGLASRLDRLEDANAQNKVALEKAVTDNQALADENADLRQKLADAEKQAKADEKTAAKTAKADEKTAKETQDHIESASTTADPAVESGDNAKVDAARVVADRAGEGKAPESGNAAAPGEQQDVKVNPADKKTETPKADDKKPADK